MRGLAHPPLDRVFATNAAITYINRRCECFLAHDGGLPLVGKAPEIGMSKYRFDTMSNCFPDSRQVLICAVAGQVGVTSRIVTALPFDGGTRDGLETVGPVCAAG